MKKVKKPGSLTGFGIGLFVFLGIVMVVHTYFKFPKEPFHMRILNGMLYFGFAFFGTGIIWLALFLAVYFAIKLAGSVYVPKESDDGMMQKFMDLEAPIFIVCFIASYAIIFFGV